MNTVFAINFKNVGIFISICLVLLYTFGIPSFHRFDEKVDIRKVLSVSIEMAIRGGKRVKIVRNSADIEERSKGKEVEGKKDVLTAGDLQSHLTIVSGFTKAFPNLHVISEEHVSSTPEFSMDDSAASSSFIDSTIASLPAELVPISDLVVWVDPLDATYEYSEKLTEYVTTMVCVARRGQPVIGVIFRPFTDEIVWSYSDKLKSKTLNDIIDNKPKFNNVTDIKLVVSRSHRGDVEKTARKVFSANAAVSSRHLQVLEAAGAGFKVLEVVSGKAEVYMHTTNIKKWDFCAGDAILRSTGGRMTTLTGSPFEYSGTLGGALNTKGLVATAISSNHGHYIDSSVQAPEST